MISQAIASYMKQHNISLSLLSEKTGMGASELEATFRGDHILSIEEYATLCNVLGVSYDLFYQMDRRSD